MAILFPLLSTFSQPYAYITDWQANNPISKDRYHEGRCKGLIDCGCGVERQPDNQVATK